MKVSRKLVLLSLAAVFGLVLISPRSNAQWWKLSAPRDFEECSDNAERAATSKETQASLIGECDAKFAGRRKSGGGYTYYDFMQNRHFDIAGPNPTPEELKQIDIQYTKFLDRQRQSILEAASMAEHQMQQARVELAKETQPAPPGQDCPWRRCRFRSLVRRCARTPRTVMMIRFLAAGPNLPQRCNDSRRPFLALRRRPITAESMAMTYRFGASPVRRVVLRRQRYMG